MMLELLTQEKVQKLINNMVNMSEQLEGDYWNLEHYLFELNKKWELSYGAYFDNQLVAFMIVSDKGTNHHLHRLVVEKNHHNNNIGSLLMNKLIDDAIRNNKHFVTLKVHSTNLKARNFYKKKGFNEVEQCNENFLYRLNLQL